MQQRPWPQENHNGSSDEKYVIDDTPHPWSGARDAGPLPLEAAFHWKAAKLVPDDQAQRVLEALEEVLPDVEDVRLTPGLLQLRALLEAELCGDDSPFLCGVYISTDSREKEISLTIIAQEPSSVLTDLFTIVKRIIAAWPGENLKRQINGHLYFGTDRNPAQTWQTEEPRVA